MTQPSLLDAIAARDEAIQRADTNANERWKQAAYDVVCHLADALGEFTTDDVWECLEDAAYTTHEPRAMGAVIQRAKRDGLITGTGRYVQSTRGVNHARPVAIWRAA